jgi:hypothetical protein
MENKVIEDLPADPGRFWRAGEDLASLRRPAAGGAAPPALERLGASPFPKSKCPFLGFLATVYDHVAGCMNQKGGPREGTG